MRGLKRHNPVQSTWLIYWLYWSTNFKILFGRHFLIEISNFLVFFGLIIWFSWIFDGLQDLHDRLIRFFIYCNYCRLIMTYGRILFMQYLWFNFNRLKGEFTFLTYNNFKITRPQKILQNYHRKGSKNLSLKSLTKISSFNWIDHKKRSFPLRQLKFFQCRLLYTISGLLLKFTGILAALLGFLIGPVSSYTFTSKSNISTINVYKINPDQQTGGNFV